MAVKSARLDLGTVATTARSFRYPGQRLLGSLALTPVADGRSAALPQKRYTEQGASANTRLSHGWARSDEPVGAYLGVGSIDRQQTACEPNQIDRPGAFWLKGLTSAIVRVEAHQTPRRFTLVELLVTIAIIAVLASLVLPMVGRARISAVQRLCASNLRQLYHGLEIYADENDDCYPNRGFADWSRWDHWYNAIDECVGVKDIFADGNDTKWAPTPFRCPAVSRNWGVSYVGNCTSVFHWGPHGGVTTPAHYYRRASITFPERRLVWIDGQDVFPGFVDSPGNTWWAGRVKYRHGDRATFFMLNGASECYAWFANWDNYK